MRHFYILLLLVLLAACGTKKAEKPLLIAPTAKLEAKQSYLSAPLVIPMDELADKINEKITGVIYKDDSYEGDKLKMTVTKVSPFVLSMSGNRLYHSVTLNIKASYKAKVIGVKSTDMTAKLHFVSKVVLDEKWHLVTKTKSKKIEWIKKPKVKLGFLKISLGGLVDRAIRKKQPELEEKIDAAIYKHVDLKKMVGKVWENLQKPITINKKVENVALKVDPRTLEVGKISGTAEYLKIDLGMSLFLRTLIGEDSKSFPSRPLPPLTLNKRLRKDFDLSLFSLLPYERVNEILSRQLVGEYLESDGYRVEVKDAEIYPSDTNLVVALTIKGDAEGTFYLRGTPKYHPQDTSLRIANFDFDLETEEILLSSANWLLGDTFKEEIQELLHLPLHDKLEDIPELIKRGIANSKISQKVDFSLQEMQVIPQDLILSKEGIEVMVNAKGRIAVRLKNL
ncbi:MAG: DUF4403 family protein [Bacteroidota bacterium]